MNTPGVEYCTTVVGFNLLSYVRNTYSGFFFIRLKEWSERKNQEERASAIIARLNRDLGQLPQGNAFAFSPPAIQGVGTAGGVTFILEDRSGRDIEFPGREHPDAFLAAARKRPELARVTTTLLPGVPQYFVAVDRDKVLSQGVDLGQVYGTLQAFMGGQFVNYFNRFGREWQVYVEAEGDYRTDVKLLGQFYVRNSNGDPVPLAAVTKIERRDGPGVHHALQPLPVGPDQRHGRARLQFGPGDDGAGGGVRPDDACRHGLRLPRHVLPGAEGAAGGAARGRFSRFRFCSCF